MKLTTTILTLASMALANSGNNKDTGAILIDIRLANINVWKGSVNNSIIESKVNNKDISERNRYTI